MPIDHYLNIAMNFSLGAAVAAYGTLVGAGGGFLLVPIFLLLHKLPHEMAVGTSLFIVVANASSGTLGYVRQKKIDYRAGILFALATLPGAVLGALSTSMVSGLTFQKVFGVVLSTAALYLLVRKKRKEHEKVPERKGWGWVHRKLISVHHTFTYSYFEPLGLGFSTVVGAFSSWLGIGGGIIHVPLLTEVLGFPVPVAVATSHFILSWTAFIGTIVHIWEGHVDFLIAVPAAVGALLGAQAGVWISKHVHGHRVIQALALALLAVGIRLLVR